MAAVWRWRWRRLPNSGCRGHDAIGDAAVGTRYANQGVGAGDAIKIVRRSE